MELSDNPSQLKERIKELEQQNEQLEKSLQESEKRESITLNSIGDAVISTDKAGNVVQMNPVAGKLTGWDVENAKGKAFEEVFNIFDALTGEKAVNPIDKVLEKGTVEGLANHTKLISKDGNEYQVADSAAPIKDDEGYIHGVIAVFRDVTEEYKKNQQIKENKEFLETTFQSIQDGVSVLNPDLTISYVNHVMESWYSDNMPLVGRKCYKAYHNSSDPCDPCPAVRCMKTKKTETEIVPGSPAPNSPVKWLELYSYPIIDSDSGEVKGVVEFVRDITQREEAEKELKRHKDLLAKSQEIAHVGSWELDLTQNRLIWSDEVYRIFGLEPQEFEATYEAFLNMVPPDDRKAVSDAYESSIIDGRDHYEIEHRIVRKKNGEIRYVYEKCEHVRDETGKVIKSIGVVQDITAQRQSEENFRKLFENAPIGVFRTNSKGKPLMANKTMANILGFETPEEVIEYYDDLAEQLYVDPQRRQEFLRIMKDQGWVENFEYEAKRKDGKRIWLSMTAKFSNEKDDNGFVIDGFTSDITERKETNRKLEKRENFISALLNNLNVGVVACDAEGILTYFNKKTREFHGLPLENIPPEDWANYYDLYRVDGQTRMNTEEIPLYRALSGEYFNEMEMVIKPREESYFSILNSGQPLKDDQGNITGAVVAMHDITERKQFEHKLQKKYEELETTEEELRASNEELHEANQKLEEQKNEMEIYKRMVESSEDMMAVVDAEYNYISVNNAYLKYYQLNREEVIGTEAKKIIGDEYFEKTVKPNLDRCLEGETVQFEMIREFPGIGKVNLDIIYFPLEINEEIKGVVSAIRDITERKIMEENLIKEKDRAERNELITKKNLRNIKFLADSAINFVDDHYEEDIYKYIVEKIRELNPRASVVVLNKVDHVNHLLQTKAIEIRDDNLNEFLNEKGIQLLEQKYVYDDRLFALKDEEVKKVEISIRELTFEKFPEAIASKIEEKLDLGNIYSITFVFDAEIYANAFILFSKGNDLENKETLETFVKQASLALKRKESEEKLIEARQHAETTANKFHSLVEQSSEMLFLHDEDGQIIEVNRAGEDNTGYSREELYAMNIMDVDPDARDRDDMRKYWKALSVNDPAVTFETRHKRKDGSIYPAEVVVSKIILENERCILAIARDITERKQAEEQLIRAKEKAEENDRLKSAFLANMSHEIRTPMNGIIGFSQILQESDYPKDQQKKFLNIIHSRTQHLLHIINDLVDVSKIEANQLKLNFQQFCLNDVMKELYRVYKNQLYSGEKSHIELKVNTSLNHANSFIYSDPSRFRQIMDNLLNNAIKFTHEGSIEFGYELPSEEQLLFYVKDTGIGISSNQQKNIFERFRQADDTTSGAYEGTGLGLTISRHLAELMGGQMWVETKEGEGSVFYFTLPYKSQNKEEEEPEQEKPDYNWQGKTFLIVEDDPTSLEYMKEVLEPMGATLILKQTGEEGYQAFKDNTAIDLILMDIRLPDINGTEIIKRIRETNNEVNIIAQTAHAMGEDRNLCLQAGADDYIAKPIGSRHIIKIINKYV